MDSFRMRLAATLFGRGFPWTLLFAPAGRPFFFGCGVSNGVSSVSNGVSRVSNGVSNVSNGVSTVSDGVSTVTGVSSVPARG